MISKGSSYKHYSVFKPYSESCKDNMAIHQAIELVALLHFDAKIDQESKFESNMLKVIVGQFKNNPDMSLRSLALCWLFCKAHAMNPLGQFIKVLNYNQRNLTGIFVTITLLIRQKSDIN